MNWQESLTFPRYFSIISNDLKKKKKPTKFQRPQVTQPIERLVRVKLSERAVRKMKKKRKNKELTFDKYRIYKRQYSTILSKWPGCGTPSFILIAFNNTETERKPNIALTFSCMANDVVIEYSIQLNWMNKNCQFVWVFLDNYSLLPQSKRITLTLRFIHQMFIFLISIQSS